MKGIKRLWDVAVLTLAINCIVLIGVGLWVASESKLDKEKFEAIKLVLFPPPPSVVEELKEEEPSPAEQLIALLDKQAGKPTEVRLSDTTEVMDTRVAAVDRRARELGDLQRQITLAQRQLDAERQKLKAEREAFEQQLQSELARQKDDGFRESLELYQQMQPRQVKQIFMDLQDDAVLAYFQAMEPRTAAKIIREFREPVEVDRIRTVLERMRSPELSQQQSADAVTPGAGLEVGA